MSKLFEQLVKLRGVDENFLHPKYENLMDSLSLPDMEVALERIELAIENQEKVLIYGDYDVDGVTSSTVMEEALRLAGVASVEIMLPDRFVDGYGMSPKLVERAKEQKISLVVTVDCGSANKEIIQQLKEAGIDTIVTDHHECPAELPEAVAIVNPKRKEFEGFRDLAGVGVAFKVAQGLVEMGLIPEGREKWLLDLVLIGTVCDNMPLVDENRILGYYGAIVLGKKRRIGLAELMQRAKVKQINAEAIGFQIGPRLNAAGRLETAELSLKLLRTKQRAEAAQLADKLEALNIQRKTEQREAIKEIVAHGVDDKPVIVEVGKYHEGIIGIVAGRLVESCKRPAFVLTEVDGGVLKGSGRSFGEFNLAEALNYCRDLLIGGGGHAGAAGVKLEKKNLAQFRDKINEFYYSLNLVNQERFLQVKEDLAVTKIGELSLELLEELKQFEPFGEGNCEPIWRLDGVVTEVRRMGSDGKHLSLTVLGDDQKSMRLVGFFAPEQWFELEPGVRHEILVRLTENEWRDMRSVEGMIVDIVV